MWKKTYHLSCIQNKSTGIWRDKMKYPTKVIGQNESILLTFLVKTMLNFIGLCKQIMIKTRLHIMWRSVFYQYVWTGRFYFCWQLVNQHISIQVWKIVLFCWIYKLSKILLGVHLIMSLYLCDTLFLNDRTEWLLLQCGNWFCRIKTAAEYWKL